MDEISAESIPSIPTKLYHYTDTAGLAGIVEGAQFFATDVEFLNDSRELQSSAGLVEEWVDLAIERYAKSSEPNASHMSLRLDILRSQLRSLTDGTSQTGQRLYSVSFCAEGDLLSQWRGYGQTDGYALGFDATLLATSTSKGESVPLVQVTYEQPREEISQLEAHLRGQDPGWGIWGGIDAMNEALRILVKTKDPSFREEKEWRLARLWQNQPEDLEFRPTRSGLVPYIRIDWPRAALVEIRLGPGGDPALRTKLVEQLLRRYNRPNPVRITESDVPLRN